MLWQHDPARLLGDSGKSGLGCSFGMRWDESVRAILQTRLGSCRAQAAPWRASPTLSAAFHRMRPAPGAPQRSLNLAPRCRAVFEALCTAIANPPERRQLALRSQAAGRTTARARTRLPLGGVRAAGARTPRSDVAGRAANGRFRRASRQRVNGGLRIGVLPRRAARGRHAQMRCLGAAAGFLTLPLATYPPNARSAPTSGE